MKLKILLISILVSLTGCISIYHNTDESVKFSNKAIMLLETKGEEFSGKRGLFIKRINGKIPESTLSTSKVEFKPGNYQIEFSIYGTGGLLAGVALGVAGGTAASNTYMLGTDRSEDNPNEFDLNLQGGHIYLVSFSYDDNDEVIITVEEV